VDVATLFRFPSLRAQAAHLKAPIESPPIETDAPNRTKLLARRKRVR
jgi:hypothetical protein